MAELTRDNSVYVARLQSSSGGVLPYQVPAPLVQPLTLWLFSRQFAILGSAGNALDNLGVEILFQAGLANSVNHYTSSVDALN